MTLPGTAAADQESGTEEDAECDGEDRATVATRS